MGIVKKVTVRIFTSAELFLVHLLQYIREIRQWHYRQQIYNKVPVNPNDSDFALIVTTFEARFFKYALPLLKEIREHTDIPVYLVINGNYEKNSQSNSLRKFLSSVSQFINIYPVAFANLRGCSALWNSGIELTDSSHYLILNDDIHLIGSNLLSELEVIGGLLVNHGLVTINGTFSHFAISEKCIEEVGLFDEHFLGFGHEDGEYMHRYLNTYGKRHLNYSSNNFFDLSDNSKDQSVINQKTGSKYSLFNQEMIRKIYVVDEEKGIMSTFDKPLRRVSEFVHPRPLSSYRRRNYRKLSE